MRFTEHEKASRLIAVTDKFALDWREEFMAECLEEGRQADLRTKLLNVQGFGRCVG